MTRQDMTDVELVNLGAMVLAAAIKQAHDEGLIQLSESLCDTKELYPRIHGVLREAIVAGRNYVESLEESR